MQTSYRLSQPFKAHDEPVQFDTYRVCAHAVATHGDIEYICENQDTAWTVGCYVCGCFQLYSLLNQIKHFEGVGFVAGLYNKGLYNSLYDNSFNFTTRVLD